MSLDVSTQQLYSYNEGAMCLLAALLLSFIFGIGDTLIGNPKNSDVLPVTALNVSALCILTFTLYYAYLPQKQ